MAGSNTYSQHTNTRKNTNSFRAIRTVLLCSVLLFGIPAIAQNNPPSFVNGVSQVFGACESVSGTPTPTSINSILAVNDLDIAQTETWTISIAPLHGILGGFSESDTSNGGVVTPLGLSYTPDSGYVGTDSFTIQVTDGIDVATTTVVVSMSPLPTLSSTRSPAAICDQTTFYYSPTSATGGATFAWHRAFTAGISNAPASGVGNVLETLGNLTYYNVPVTYTYTVMANGCTGSPERVVVIVKPTPLLSSSLNDTVCSGGVVNYVPMSATSGTTYTWSRAVVAGISPDTATGSGTITESLTNSTSAPVTTVYDFALAANGCTSPAHVNITVNPQPPGPLTSITTAPSSSVCAGTQFMNFGASIAPPSGITYRWSASNANIFSTGSDGQYILVSFPNSGSASVTLSYNDAGAQCLINNVYSLTVGAGPAPVGSVLYNNYQFVYLDNTVDNYQWGYDNTSTLDSTLISGATFQSYVNPAPDFADNFYWVLTSKDGCMQKTYFNAPAAVTNVNGGSMNLKVYPNPASGVVNVEMSSVLGSNTTVSVVNMLGQTIKTQTVTGHTAQLDIAGLADGCYLVTCLQNGMKIATARFVKN